MEHCISNFCFAPLDAGGTKFFGFSEFLASLALMVLAWTIADVRYRFRIRTAPIPLATITFYTIAALGVLTLFTDLWRAQEWLVPVGKIISPAMWQFVLGLTFLTTFLLWVWFAFIHPPLYGKSNAARYGQTLYRYILRGSPQELSVVADELAFSAKNLIANAPDVKARRHQEKLDEHRGIEHKPEELSRVEGVANDILLLIADKRFCRAVVTHSPGTALAVFREIGEAKKYGVAISTFTRNIMNEAMQNSDSFLFHEVEGYYSGLIGHLKPLTQAIFANYEMVEEIGTLLDFDFDFRNDWTPQQLEAFSRLASIVVKLHAEANIWSHSFVLYRALGTMESAVRGLYRLDGVQNSIVERDEVKRLRIVIDFVCDAAETLEKAGVAKNLPPRVRETAYETVFDHLAKLTCDVILEAASVQSPPNKAWIIQHSDTWRKISDLPDRQGQAGKLLFFKIRRILYNDIVEMDRFPNFKGAQILGFCLNVMGLTISDKKFARSYAPLHRVILNWTKRHFAWLYSYNKRIGEKCLVDGFEFDADNLRIVRTYPADNLRREPKYIYFSVDAPTPGSEHELG